MTAKTTALAKKVTKAPADPVVPYYGSNIKTSQAKLLGSDSEFQNQENNLYSDWTAYRNDVKHQAGNYYQDELTGLNRLGYTGAVVQPGAVSKNDAFGVSKIDTSKAHWNGADQTTAYGSTMNNMNNDFAARGAGHSTFFHTAQANTQQNFQNQVDAINTAGARYGADTQSQLSTQQNYTNNARRQAVFDALARKATNQQSLIQ